MTEHKDNSKYIWGQFLFTKKKKKCYTERKENTQPQFILMQLCDPNPSIHWGREANEGGKEGQHAEGAHTVPMCQHSSFFITYLRVELGGWVRQTDREREGNKRWVGGGKKRDAGWTREQGKDDVLLFSLLLIIYTSQFTGVCNYVSACVCFRTWAQYSRQSFSEMSHQWDAPLHVPYQHVSQSVGESAGIRWLVEWSYCAVWIICM